MVLGDKTVSGTLKYQGLVARDWNLNLLEGSVQDTPVGSQPWGQWQGMGWRSSRADQVLWGQRMGRSGREECQPPIGFGAGVITFSRAGGGFRADGRGGMVSSSHWRCSPAGDLAAVPLSLCQAGMMPQLSQDAGSALGDIPEPLDNRQLLVVGKALWSARIMRYRFQLCIRPVCAFPRAVIRGHSIPSPRRGEEEQHRTGQCLWQRSRPFDSAMGPATFSLQCVACGVGWNGVGGNGVSGHQARSCPDRRVCSRIEGCRGDYDKASGVFAVSPYQSGTGRAHGDKPLWCV